MKLLMVAGVMAGVRSSSIAYACWLVGVVASIAVTPASSARDWRIDAGARATANWLEYRSATSSAGAPVAGGGTSSSPASDTVPGAEVFAAVAPNDAVRLELSYERLRSHEIGWTTEFRALPGLPSTLSATSRIDLWMVSAYLFPVQMLATVPADIEPFIGLGVGQVRARLTGIQESFFTSGQDALVSSGRSTETAYRIALGVAKNLTPNIRADISLRYARLGESISGSSRSGEAIAGDQAIEPYRFKLRSSGIAIGLAYRF